MNQVDHLSRCRQLLAEVLLELGSKIDKNQVDEIADLIIESMEGNYRYFHTFDHVLMVTKTNDPLAFLVLFHNLKNVIFYALKS